MANKEIGDLTAASSLTGSELVHVVQSSNSRRTTTQAIADLSSGLPESALTKPASGDFSIELNSASTYTTNGANALSIGTLSDASLIVGWLNSAGGADFTATARVGVAYGDEFSGAGLVVRSSTGAYLGWGPMALDTAGGGYIEYMRWTDHTTFGSGNNGHPLMAVPVWVRVFYDHSAGTIQGSISMDGESWINAPATDNSLSTNVDAVGIAVFARSTSPGARGWFWHYGVS